MREDYIRLKPIGGMDSDSELLDINNQRYLTAKHIRQVTRDGQTSYAVENMVGNTLIFVIPQVNPSQKKYEFYIDQSKLTSGTETWNFEIYDSNGNKFGATTPFVINSSGSGTTLTNLITAFDGLMTALSFTTTKVSGTYPNGAVYLQFTINTLLYADFKLYLIAPTTSVCTVKTYILNESIPSSISGDLRPIAGVEVNNDIFLLSTTQDSLPTYLPLNIVGATNASPIEIQLSGNHNLVSGSKVIISGVLGNSAANGMFNINVTGVNKFTLVGSTGSGAFSASPDAKVQYNIEGVTQIGVVTHDLNTDIHTYTPLLTTKELNLVSEKQPDIRGEDNIYRKAFYWVDDYNYNRCWYYTGDYALNGSIFHPVNNPTGMYNYGSIAIETQLSISNINVDLTFKRVNNTGGELPSGNIMYWVRFLNDGLTETDWLGPINPINIFKGSYTNVASDTDARNVIGDDALTQTSKSVEIEIGNIPNVFKYFEVGYGYLSGNGTFLKSGILPRTLVAERTTITFIHTGTEVERDLDVGTVNKSNAIYPRSKNIDILDQRLILSNNATKDIVDLTEFAQTFRHSIKLDKMDSVFADNGSGSFDKLRVAEYMLPENVNGKMGYMYLERYRFYLVGELYNGGLTDPFWIDDIIIDNLTYARRDETLPDLSFGGYTSGTVATQYHHVASVEFHGFNLDYLINGVPVRQLIKRFHIYRCEVDNPTILGHGISVPCVSGIFEASDTGPTTRNETAYRFPDPYDTVPAAYKGEFPFIGWNHVYRGWQFDGGSFVGYPLAGNGANRGTTFTAEKKYCSFYSWDRLYNQNPWDVLPGDYLLNFGQGTISRDADIVSSITNWGGGTAYNQFTYFKHVDNYSGNLPTSKILINEGGYIKPGDELILNTTDKFAKRFTHYEQLGANGIRSVYKRPESYILRLDTDINYLSSGTDYGVYFTAYYRALSAFAQYGDISGNKVIPTGAILDISKANYTVCPAVSGIYNVGVFRVYGGDTFTHSAALHINSRDETYFSATGSVDPDGTKYGNAAIIYTTQSKINVMMRAKDEDNTKPFQGYPNLKEYLEDHGSETALYNEGYNVKNAFNIIKKAAFDPSTIRIGEQFTMIAYSGKKFLGSTLDSYRSFLPLDIAILDYTNGPINAMMVSDGVLYTWQTKAFNRHYFNSDGVFTTQDGAEVIIGSGGVMSRKEANLSWFGCSNKWSVIKGRSMGGKDVLYWISGNAKKIIRHGADGTVILSDRSFQASKIVNGIKWAVQFDNPVLGKGISASWMQKFSEVTWYIKGRRIVEKWGVSGAYSIGDVMEYDFGPDSTEIFISKINSNSTPPSVPDSDDNWEMVSHDNTDYYSEFSIVFNEKNNFFSTHMGFFIGLSIPWNETLLHTDTFVVNKSLMYQADKGADLVFFDFTVDGQGYIEMILNKDPEITKRFDAIYVGSKIRPYRVEFKTENHFSFLDYTDFEQIEDGFWSPIKNDATRTVDNPNGNNDLDTSKLWGKYLKVKFYFHPQERQVLKHVIIKCQGNHRAINQ